MSTEANNTSDKPKGPVVCVFCGASAGNSPAHMEAARALARTMAANNMTLVYGGGTVGLMGEVARTLVALAGPGSVHGIIPAPLVRREQGVDEDNRAAPIDEAVYGRTTVVRDMHTRKRMMAQEVINGPPGGGFVALSGGYGTLEELMEITTWNQLGIHDRPVVLFNVDGYWDGLVQWVRKAVDSGFVGKDTSGIIVEAKSAEDVINNLANYEAAAGRFKLDWEDQ